MDKSNFVDKLIFNPRFSVLYKLKNLNQIRLSWGQGFRAPQAFDSDLHIAFAGGGISRVQLADDLIHEKSNSVSLSYNADFAKPKYVVGFTMDGFYTHLNNVFYLEAIGEDEFGEVFLKSNGQAAKVYGASLDFRFNYNRVFQIETGIRLQRSFYTRSIEILPEFPKQTEFMRTPNVYGYTLINITPAKNYYINFNIEHTGKMKVPHFAGAPNQTKDEIITSQIFNNLSYKAGYRWMLNNSQLELFGGIKNIFNAYQNDFDMGKNRDSNFIYGPATPRTFYLGIVLRNN